MEEFKENDDIVNETANDQEPLLKPKRKMKKFPRSDKQQEAFTKAMKKRAENVELRKQQKKIEAAKLLLAVTKQTSKEKKEPEQEEEAKPKPKLKTKHKKQIAPESDSDLNTDDDDESSEDEAEDYDAIYKQYVQSKKSVKSKPKPKTKVKKVYILKKDIEEEDDDDDVDDEVQLDKKKNDLKTRHSSKHDDKLRGEERKLLDRVKK